MITNARLSTLYVVDQEQVAAFLTGPLGFETITDVAHDGGRRWVEVRPVGGQTSVALATVTPQVHAALARTAGRMAHGWFDCADLDGSCTRLRKHGVRVIVGPEPAPWNTRRRWAQIADPAGNLYGLTEPGDHFGGR